jgi:capsid portal protein
MKNKKPQVKKPKSQVKLTKGKSNILSYGVVNLAVPQHIEEPQNLSNIPTEWVPWGCNNDFPQYLAELKRQSPTHRAILTQKTTFTSGRGFSSESENLNAWAKRVNADNETLRDVFKKLVDDYYSFGNAFMEIVQYEGGFNIYHIDATTVRVAKDKKSVYMNYDWEQYSMLADKTESLPLYPSFESSRSVVQFKDYEPTFHFYGLPDYIGSLEHIAIDYEIGKWNHSKFKNSFQPSAIIEINGDMSEEEAKKMVKEAQSKFLGEGNQGKIMFIVKGSGDTTPANVQIIKDDQDGSWDVLQTLTIQAIHTAHRWQPALSGVVSAGKMNSTGAEIRIAYEIVQNIVVNETAEVFLQQFREIFHKLGGFDCEDLEIIYEPPISYLSDIKPNEVLTINEQREILGKEPIEGGDMFYLQLKGGTQAKVDEEVLEDVEDESDQNTTNIEIETDGKL